MQITVTAASRCQPQGSHIHLTVSVTLDNGQTETFPLETTVQELTASAGERFGSAQQASAFILARLISAAKEAGAITLAQAQAAVLNKTFKL